MANNEGMEKVAQAVQDTILRNVYVPVFLKAAADRGVPMPQNEDDLAKMLQMADTLVDVYNTKQAQLGTPVSQVYDIFAKQAGFVQPQYQQQYISPEEVINDEDVNMLTKAAMSYLNNVG